MVRVDRFKDGGKWYDSFAINMEGVYDHPSVHDAVQLCIEQAGYTMEGWIYVCLEPYHRHAYPVMLKGRVTV